MSDPRRDPLRGIPIGGPAAAEFGAESLSPAFFATPSRADPWRGRWDAYLRAAFEDPGAEAIETRRPNAQVSHPAPSTPPSDPMSDPANRFHAPPSNANPAAARFAAALDASSESLAKFAATLVTAPCDVVVELCNQHLCEDLIAQIKRALPDLFYITNYSDHVLVTVPPKCHHLILHWHTDQEHFTSTIAEDAPPEALFVCCWETTTGVAAHVRVQAPDIEWPSAVWRNGGWHCAEATSPAATPAPPTQ
jgi:hypothetical protein